MFYPFLEDLQAEIDEIDDDIASMRKELRVSDTSDTSLAEEMITLSVAEQHISLSDSPEFWAGHLGYYPRPIAHPVMFTSS